MVCWLTSVRSDWGLRRCDPGVRPGRGRADYADRVSSSRTETVPTKASAALKVAALVLVVEGLVAIGLGVVDAVNTHASRPVVGIGGALFMMLYAALLLVLARGLVRTRPWCRGPVVATQVIHLPVAFSFRPPTYF